MKLLCGVIGGFQSSNGSYTAIKSLYIKWLSWKGWKKQWRLWREGKGSLKRKVIVHNVSKDTNKKLRDLYRKLNWVFRSGGVFGVKFGYSWYII